MPTDPQTHANRTNGLAGSETHAPEGKSLFNPDKHGLAAGLRVLSNENQEEFDELIADYHRDLAPTNIHEQFLVEEMAQARWRLARFRRLETALIEQMVGLANPADTDFILAAALLNGNAGPLNTVQRYAAAAERSYYRAMRELQAGRKPDAPEAEKPARPGKPKSPPSTSGQSDETPPARGNPSSDGGWKMSGDDAVNDAIPAR